MPTAGPTYPVANNNSWRTLADVIVSQSFLTSGGNHGLYDFTLQLRKTGVVSTGNIYLMLYTDDGSGKPDKLVENGLSQTILNASTVSGAGASYTFNFFTTPPYLFNATTYHIVIASDQDWDGTNFIEVGYDNTPAFASGNLCFFASGGTVWTTDLTKDVGFSSQYTDVVPGFPENVDIDLTWSCNCDSQDELMESNIGSIASISSVMFNKIQPVLYAYLPYFPGQGYWESLWVREGNSLPLPEGITLLWYDTLRNKFGATYTVINGVVTEVIFNYMKGISYGRVSFAQPSTNRGVALSNSYAGLTIGVQSAGTIVVPVTSYLRFSASIAVQNTVGWNYFINSVNQYNTEFGTALNTDHYAEFIGPAGPSFAPFQIKWQHYVTLAPGSYTFEIRYFSPAGTGQYQSHYGQASGFNAQIAGVSTTKLNSLALIVA